MSRPHEPEKRRSLARRAVEVLQAEGMDISMRHLAEALDVKRPTLLYHFPSRVDIILAALEDLLTEQASFVIAKIEEHTHPIDRIYARIRAVHEFHGGKEERFVFLSHAIAGTGEERMKGFIKVGNAVFEAHRQAQVATVKQGIEDGIVHPCDVDALMALTRAITDGLLVQRVMTGVALEPSHDFLWDQILEPLKREKQGKQLS